ncbi:methyl-accepting chemotaxis protein [Pigmentiphaga litoralis]|jgi:methyl-accepting chemotaxis protein|uniref:methyl-accepting chemotaxis protein n=1 Tax=Pigmentiphaga litoralis TaxID=516702 RepID=UPI0016764E15|nr:methyl-accepting chemotaxis protein [Pigmentiphaga litoralis]GGX17109.1 methyl-accepting chemotaxis protein [Pigmentiphaga litoralis]
MASSFSLGQRSLAKQVLVLALSLSAIISGVTAVVVAVQGVRAARQAVEREMMASLDSVSSSLVSSYESTRLRVERQLLVFQRMLGELPSPDGTMTETGTAGEVVTVRAGETILNGNTSVLQRMRSYTGADPELIVRHNNQWIRAATMQRGADGQPLTGAAVSSDDFVVKTLDTSTAATNIVYRGGRWYAMHVRPLKDDNGKIFGGLTLQVDLSDDVASTLKYIEESTVAGFGSMFALTSGANGSAEFLVHPTYKGKLVSDTPEADRPEFQKLVDEAAGFTESKMTTDDATQFVAFKTVPSWGWTLAAQGAKSDFLAAQYKQIALVVALLLISGILTGLVVFARMSFALRPVRDVVAGVTRLGEGDLTRDVPTGPAGSNNEIHIMAERINATRVRIAQLAQQMNATGSQVAVATTQTLQALNQIGRGTEVQSEAASGVAAAVEELTVSISQIADSTREANGFSKASSTAAEEGSAVVKQTVSEIEKMADRVANSAEVVQQLEASSRQISAVVKTIQEIAEQTNLLALNAAIEAARAGEEGRGFSVVADEVRGLAERTKTSTAQIASVIAAVQKQTTIAAQTMREVNTDMQASAAGARQAGTVLSRIQEAASRTAEVIADISNAAMEQKSASEQIASRVEQIAQYAEESAAAVQQSVASAESLQNQAQVLDETIRTLRT